MCAIDKLHCLLHVLNNVNSDPGIGSCVRIPVEDTMLATACEFGLVDQVLQIYIQAGSI